MGVVEIKQTVTIELAIPVHEGKNGGVRLDSLLGALEQLDEGHDLALLRVVDIFDKRSDLDKQTHEVWHLEVSE